MANDYTYPQLLHIAETYVKDRMLVVRQVTKALGFKGDKSAQKPTRPGPDGEPEKPHRASGTDHRGLYPWYDPPYRVDRYGRRRKTVHKVVALDGPMERLAPYVGKGKVGRAGMRVSRDHRIKKVDRKMRERRKKRK